jgi:hypothetical protein
MLQLRIESGDFYFYFSGKEFQNFPIQKTIKFRQFEKKINHHLTKKFLILNFILN